MNFRNPIKSMISGLSSFLVTPKETNAEWHIQKLKEQHGLVELTNASSDGTREFKVGDDVVVTIESFPTNIRGTITATNFPLYIVSLTEFWADRLGLSWLEVLPARMTLATDLVDFTRWAPITNKEDGMAYSFAEMVGGPCGDYISVDELQTWITAQLKEEDTLSGDMLNLLMLKLGES